MDEAMERLGKLEVIEQICNDNRADIKQLSKFILGNGKKGIFQRLDDLENFQQKLETMEKEHRVREFERMKSFRNLKYAIYMMIAGWLFTIGYGNYTESQALKKLNSEGRLQSVSEKTELIDQRIDKKLDELLKHIEKQADNK